MEGVVGKQNSDPATEGLSQGLNFQTLPDDLKILICRFLGNNDLLRLSQVSSSCLAVSRNFVVWQGRIPPCFLNADGWFTSYRHLCRNLKGLSQPVLSTVPNSGTRVDTCTLIDTGSKGAFLSIDASGHLSLNPIEGTPSLFSYSDVTNCGYLDFGSTHPPLIAIKQKSSEGNDSFFLVSQDKDGQWSKTVFTLPQTTQCFPFVWQNKRGVVLYREIHSNFFLEFRIEESEGNWDAKQTMKGWPNSHLMTVQKNGQWWLCLSYYGRGMLGNTDNLYAWPLSGVDKPLGEGHRFTYYAMKRPLDPNTNVRRLCEDRLPPTIMGLWGVDAFPIPYMAITGDSSPSCLVLCPLQPAPDGKLTAPLWTVALPKTWNENDTKGHFWFQSQMTFRVLPWEDDYLLTVQQFKDQRLFVAHWKLFPDGTARLLSSTRTDEIQLLKPLRICSRPGMLTGYLQQGSSLKKVELLSEWPDLPTPPDSAPVSPSTDNAGGSKTDWQTVIAAVDKALGKAQEAPKRPSSPSSSLALPRNNEESATSSSSSSSDSDSDDDKSDEATVKLVTVESQRRVTLPSGRGGTEHRFTIGMQAVGPADNSGISDSSSDEDANTESSSSSDNDSESLLKVMILEEKKIIVNEKREKQQVRHLLVSGAAAEEDSSSDEFASPNISSGDEPSVRAAEVGENPTAGQQKTARQLVSAEDLEQRTNSDRDPQSTSANGGGRSSPEQSFVDIPLVSKKTPTNQPVRTAPKPIPIPVEVRWGGRLKAIVIAAAFFGTFGTARHAWSTASTSIGSSALRALIGLAAPPLAGYGLANLRQRHLHGRSQWLPTGIAMGLFIAVLPFRLSVRGKKLAICALIGTTASLHVSSFARPLRSR